MVVYCPPGAEEAVHVVLPAGATVRDAIAASDLLARWPELRHQTDAGIWGRRCTLDRPVADGDRVEIYRPLTIDPKEGRRIRALRRRRRKK